MRFRISVLFYVLVTTFFMNTVSHAGPIIVGNGAGQAEFSVIFAREHIGEFYQNCLAACGLSAEESKLLKSIASQSSENLDLLFKNSTEMGSKLFLRKTSEVWINQNLLWLDSARTVPFDVSAAAAMWTDIFNVSAKPDESLKQKLVSLISSDFKINRLQVDSNCEFSALLWKKKHGATDRLFLNDSSGKTVDLTNSVLESVSSDVVRFGQPRLMKNENAGQNSLRVEFAATYLDRSGNPTRATIDVVIGVKADNNLLVLDPSSIDITVSEE